MLPTTDTYDARTITLHWISALLVLALWVAGQCIDSFPRGDPRTAVRSLHILAGVLLAAVLAARIVWRFGGGVRLAAAPGRAGQAAVAMQHAMLGLLALIVVIGLASVWIRGDAIFNWFTVPSLAPDNKALRHNVVELHGFLADTLLVIAGLHAAAALWHHHVLKDGVLRRMWPALKPAA
jgi:cytochrome b561